jgi:hypothetical protein
MEDPIITINARDYDLPAEISDFDGLLEWYKNGQIYREHYM